MVATGGEEPLAPAEDPTGLLEADAAADLLAVAPEVVPEVSKWVGAENVEVQGCDPDSCDMMCGNCAWEPCQVLADDLCGQCTAKFEDGQVAEGIQYRHMRIGKKTKRRRAGET